MVVRVIGIDPSLTATGLSDGERHATITTDAVLSLPERCLAIKNEVLDFTYPPGEYSQHEMFVIEAPLLRAVGHGGSHLYEIGWLMAYLYDLASHQGIAVLELPNSSLKKWAFGKGNLDKAHVALACYKKWGVEFANDRGVDQAHAYMLHKYGCAVAAGEITHEPSAARGSGKRAKATVRKRANSKPLVSAS